MTEETTPLEVIEVAPAVEPVAPAPKKRGHLRRHELAVDYQQAFLDYCNCTPDDSVTIVQLVERYKGMYPETAPTEACMNNWSRKYRWKMRRKQVWEERKKDSEAIRQLKHQMAISQVKGMEVDAKTMVLKEEMRTMMAQLSWVIKQVTCGHLIHITPEAQRVLDNAGNLKKLVDVLTLLAVSSEELDRSVAEREAAAKAATPAMNKNDAMNHLAVANSRFKELSKRGVGIQ
jgi:hypothetical protein